MAAPNPATEPSNMFVSSMSKPRVGFASTSDRPQIYANYASRCSVGLGATQIYAGVAAIVASAVYGTSPSMMQLCHFAGGATVLITGMFGVVAGTFKHSCSIIGYMVLSVISTFLAVFDFMENGVMENGVNQSDWNVDCVLTITLLVASFVTSIASMWAAGICCAVVCFGSGPTCGAINRGFNPLQTSTIKSTTTKEQTEAGELATVFHISFDPLLHY